MDHRDPFEDADHDNPYAPPRPAPAQEQPMPELSGIPFNASDILNWSWAIYKDNIWPCTYLVLGPFLLDLGINVGFRIVLESLLRTVGDARLIYSFAGASFLLSIIIQIWLTIGMMRGLLKIARRQPVSFDVLFTGGRYVLPVLLAWIVVFLIFFVAMLPIVGIAVVAVRLEIGNLAPVVFVAAIVVGVVAALYMAGRLMQFFYLIIDRNAGVIDSIRLSWQLTEKRAGTIVLVYFLRGAIQIGGLLACCVGLLVAIPVNSVILAVTYLALTGSAKAPEPILTIWEEEL